MCAFDYFYITVSQIGISNLDLRDLRQERNLFHSYFLRKWVARIYNTRNDDTSLFLVDHRSNPAHLGEAGHIPPISRSL